MGTRQLAPQPTRVAPQTKTVRILLAPNSYLPVLGGLQTVANDLAMEFVRQGYQVQVVTNRYPRILPSLETLDGVPVRRWLFLNPNISYLMRGRLDLFLASLYYYPATLARYDQLFRNFRPEVVNVHFPEAQIPFIMQLRSRYEFRLVVSLHGDEVEGYFDESMSVDTERRDHSQLKRLRQILSAADAVTTCSGDLLERAIAIAPYVKEKGKVIHNGVEEARFIDQSGYHHPRPYILAYGRLTRKKGFDMLLEAYARVTCFYPDIDLIIAGDGEELQSLHQQIRRSGLEGKAHLYGRATPDEVVKLLNSSLFIVVPSRKEPFGIVALESMAAGKAVIATRVGGLPDVLDNGSNILVEPSVEDLACGLADWLADLPRVQKIGLRNLEAAAGYTWDKAAEKYLATYANTH